MLGNIKEVCRRLKKMLGIEEDFKVEKNIEKILKKSEWKIGKFWTKSRIHFKNIKKKKEGRKLRKIKRNFFKEFHSFKGKSKKLPKEIQDLKKIEFFKIL